MVRRLRQLCIFRCEPLASYPLDVRGTLYIASTCFRYHPSRAGDCCTSTCTPVSLAELASVRATTADDCVSEEIGDGFCDFELNNEVRRTALNTKKGNKAPYSRWFGGWNGLHYVFHAFGFWTPS